MAKGMKCPSCDHYMYAAKVEEQPAGAYVTYECRNRGCNNGNPNRVKVWEDK